MSVKAPSIYDATKQLIADVVGDIHCVKTELPNQWWSLWPSGNHHGSTHLRVLAGWNGEIIVAPIRVGQNPLHAESVTIGNRIPDHIAMNLLDKVITEMLAAIRHGEVE